MRISGNSKCRKMRYPRRERRREKKRRGGEGGCIVSWGKDSKQTYANEVGREEKKEITN